MKSNNSEIIKFVVNFINEHGSKEMLDEWNSETNTSAFKALISKSVKSKTTKDPSKPKRGKSSYIFFCAKKRESVKISLGEAAKPTEVTSKLGELWRELKESKKTADKKLIQTFEAEAAQDKARYDEEMKEYEPVDNIGKKKSDKDPNAPKRGKSAYIFFCADKREDAKTHLGEKATGKEIMAFLGKMWKELKADDTLVDKLAEYENAAVADKARYVEEMKNYDSSSSPKKQKSSKKKKSDKDSKAPKRGKSAYIFFCSEKRSEAKIELGEGASPNEVTVHLGLMWKELKSDSDRADELAKFTKMAEDDKARFLKETGAKSQILASSDEYDDDLATEYDSSSEKEEIVEEEVSKKKNLPKPVPQTVAKKSKKMTGCSYFCQEHRQDVKDKYPQMKAADITKELARLWKEMNKTDQQEWIDAAAEL